jgi:predicted phosphodiesterase
MRILLLSDIHANLNALQTVLDAAGAVDAVWCLGDVVGYGPDPNECIERLRKIPNLVCLLGNHDAAALGQIDLESFNREARISARWMQEMLSESSRQFLGNLPETVVIHDVTLVHGSPRNPVWEYIIDPFIAADAFNFFKTSICIVGHTHLPVIFRQSDGDFGTDWKVPVDGQEEILQGRNVVNPGSVGQPRDHDPRAAYAIFEPEKKSWTVHRVEYDFSGVQLRIQQAGLPLRHAARLSEGW